MKKIFFFLFFFICLYIFVCEHFCEGNKRVGELPKGKTSFQGLGCWYYSHKSDLPHSWEQQIAHTHTCAHRLHWLKESFITSLRCSSPAYSLDCVKAASFLLGFVNPVHYVLSHWVCITLHTSLPSEYWPGLFVQLFCNLLSHLGGDAESPTPE